MAKYVSDYKTQSSTQAPSKPDIAVILNFLQSMSGCFPRFLKLKWRKGPAAKEVNDDVDDDNYYCAFGVIECVAQTRKHSFETWSHNLG